jgi:carbon storage regulator
MLVLKRKLNESIMIGDDIEIKIISFDKDGVRIGIEAPKDFPIYRKEIYLTIQEENKQAVSDDRDKLSQLNNLFRDLSK